MELAATTAKENRGATPLTGHPTIKNHSYVLHQRHLIISLVIIGLMLAATISTILLLYQAAFENEKTLLQKIVQSQVRMIDAVTAFDALHSLNDYPEGTRGATISQIISAHQDQTTLGKSGEFLLAELRGNQMVFHLPSRHLPEEKIPNISFQGRLAEPMRRALKGESGTIAGLDYRGKTVLAAYAPLQQLDLGLVAKTDLREVRAPYIQAALLSICLVILLVLLGHIPLRRCYEKTNLEHNQLEVQLRQAQKLEAVGQLAAGIAHEINSPVQFVGDNINFLKTACQDLQTLCKKYETLIEQTPDDEALKQYKDAIRDFKAQIDFDFLRKEVDAAIDQSIEGTQRIADIVKSMKSFSHPGAAEKESTDLNLAIQSTTTIARNEWKYVADMTLDLDPELPLVTCYPGEINQTVLNLIINAAHAIEEKYSDTGNSNKGEIKITTRKQEQEAVITISDNGCGIPDTLIEKIYDPFFTTKPVGKGTGQGLAIAYSVIVDKHGGAIKVKSQPGMGSQFEIHLPLSC